MSFEDITTYCDECGKLTRFCLANVWTTVLGVAECYECENCGNSMILEEGDVV